MKVVSLSWNPREATGPEDLANEPVEGRVIPVEPVLLSVPEAAKALSIGRSEVFSMIRERRIRSIKRGRRRLIPLAELQRFAREEVRAQEED